jgi:hypothetical protein
MAERLVRFAKLGGRQSVVADADRGFSSRAKSSTEVHPTVEGAKFAALRDGARLAGKQLWTWGWGGRRKRRTDALVSATVEVRRGPWRQSLP